LFTLKYRVFTIKYSDHPAYRGNDGLGLVRGGNRMRLMVGCRLPVYRKLDSAILVVKANHNRLLCKDAQMTKKNLDWTPDLELPTGTGATLQKFKAQSGDDKLEIKATEAGKGSLKVNATEIAHVVDDRDATEVFRDLEKIAEDNEHAHQQVPQGLKSK
jgi:hypothetical protein